MKKLYLIVGLLVLLPLLIIGSGCKKQNKENNKSIECGCNSKKIGEISDKGTMIFHSPNIQDQDFFHYYGNQFWITVKKEHVISRYIVCNQDFLKEKFDYLRHTNRKEVEVKFSGITRDLCDNSPGIMKPLDAMYSYNYMILELTSIEIL